MHCSFYIEMHFCNNDPSLEFILLWVYYVLKFTYGVLYILHMIISISISSILESYAPHASINTQQIMTDSLFMGCVSRHYINHYCLIFINISPFAITFSIQACAFGSVLKFPWGSRRHLVLRRINWTVLWSSKTVKRKSYFKFWSMHLTAPLSILMVVKVLRGQRPISGRTYFRHICSLCVNFMQLWFCALNRFLI